MTRPLQIDLPADHRRLVLKILRANLPANAKAWCSARGLPAKARHYSDLHLAIDAGRPLTLDQIAGLVEAFSDSDLPYRVDVVDWLSIDDSWRQMIAAERVSLTQAAYPDAAG